MNVHVDIDAGICGFRTEAAVTSGDDQHVAFDVTSSCEKIRQLASALAGRQPLDAYQEISPEAEGLFMVTVRQTLRGCCAGCAVPAGLFKAMQVAAGLALTKDIWIRMSRTE